jgi:hypothetical protein
MNQKIKMSRKKVWGIIFLFYFRHGFKLTNNQKIKPKTIFLLKF